MPELGHGDPVTLGLAEAMRVWVSTGFADAVATLLRRSPNGSVIKNLREMFTIDTFDSRIQDPCLFGDGGS